MYEQELEILQGTIAAVVYQNYDNGYSVLRVNLENGQTATVVGTGLVMEQKPDGGAVICVK